MIEEREPELLRLWRAADGGADFPRDIAESYRAREDARRRLAYAIPSEEALAALARYGPFVEIGAGTGYWARLLHERGVPMACFDRDVRGDRHEHPYCDVDTPFMTVGKGGPEKVEDYPDHALLLIWPPYDEPMAAEALARYRGDTVAYIGEGPGGCTADDAFHEALARDWEEIERVDLPQWRGLHDDLTIYRRKGSV